MREGDPRVENKRTKGEGARYDVQRPREHHSNHDADAWSIQTSDEEEPAPSAPGSEIGNDDAASDAKQASLAHKRRKTGLTKCDEEYTVSKQREALSAKARVGVCSCAGHVKIDNGKTERKKTKIKTYNQFTRWVGL